eukprot:6921401-Alexandrium_andersonii.AAC.1
MAPKRSRSKAMGVPPDVLEAVWNQAVDNHDQQAVWDVGSYMQKDTADVATLVLWAPELGLVLDHCGNGVVCWEGIRASLRAFFLKRPRAD